MNRQTRTFVVLVVAVVAAAAASYAVYRAVASIPVRQVEIATAKRWSQRGRCRSARS